MEANNLHMIALCTTMTKFTEGIYIINECLILAWKQETGSNHCSVLVAGWLLQKASEFLAESSSKSMSTTPGRKLLLSLSGVYNEPILTYNECPHSNDIMSYVLNQVPPPRPGLPRPRFSLYLSSQLQYGVIVVYHRQCAILLGEMLLISWRQEITYTSVLVLNPKLVAFQRNCSPSWAGW